MMVETARSDGWAWSGLDFARGESGFEEAIVGCASLRRQVPARAGLHETVSSKYSHKRVCLLVIVDEEKGITVRNSSASSHHCPPTTSLRLQLVVRQRNMRDSEETWKGFRPCACLFAERKQEASSSR